jgi:hypothetical protein
MLFVLAAAIPLDRPFGQLIAWARTIDNDRQATIEQRRAILNGTFVEPLGAVA